jgi:hypothetical protein
LSEFQAHIARRGQRKVTPTRAAPDGGNTQTDSLPKSRQRARKSGESLSQSRASAFAGTAHNTGDIMNTGKSVPRTRTKRSILQAVVIIMATIAGMVGLFAAPASAAGQVCSGRPEVNVCLALAQAGRFYGVHVGIDYRISRQAAQEIIDQPGDPFFVVVMSGSTQLFYVPEAGIAASDTAGLSASFDVPVLPSQLGGRCVFARVELNDFRTGLKFFDSPTFCPPY